MASNASPGHDYPATSPSPSLLAEEHNTTTLTTFECFPKLPLELRLEIWGFFACCNPEMIVVYPKYVGSIGPRKERILFYYNRVSEAPQPPSILHVSSEARAVGFEFYRPEKTSETIMGFNVPKSGRGLHCIWVNWTVDTLLIGLVYEGDPRTTTNFIVEHVSKVIETLPKGKVQVAFQYSHSKYLQNLVDHVDEIIIYAEEWPWNLRWKRRLKLINFDGGPFEESNRCRVPSMLLDETKNYFDTQWGKGETNGSKVPNIKLRLLTDESYGE